MTWRVMTWNILGAKSPDLGALADHVRHSKPDVVALQEVRRAQAMELAIELAWNVVWRRKHFPLTPLVWWRAEGQALLSPHILSKPTAYVLSPRLSKLTYRYRVMVAATARRGDDELRVFNVHLSSSNVDERIEQARLAASFIAAESSDMRVVCGDMNAANELEVVREFHSVGVRDTGGDSTSPSHRPLVRLDYVLVPSHASVSAIETPPGGNDWAELSDHLPVVVEFAVPT